MPHPHVSSPPVELTHNVISGGRAKEQVEKRRTRKEEVKNMEEGYIVLYITRKENNKKEARKGGVLAQNTRYFWEPDSAV